MVDGSGVSERSPGALIVAAHDLRFGTRQPLEVLGRLDRHLLMLIPDTTARVGAWYPDNSLIRVDLPEPFRPEQARASAGLMVG
jgi:hypothetical protein